MIRASVFWLGGFAVQVSGGLAFGAWGLGLGGGLALLPQLLLDLVLARVLACWPVDDGLSFPLPFCRYPATFVRMHGRCGEPCKQDGGATRLPES